MRDELRANLLDPAILGPPIVWLASPDAAGVHDERIVARDFEDWLEVRAGEHIAELGDLFGVARSTVYRAIQRDHRGQTAVR